MRNGKKIVLLLTALFVGFGIAGQISADKAKSSAPAKVAAEKPSSTVAPDANVDIVYYFMTTQRCPSCMKIEAFTKETVETKFTEALKKGRMIWRMVNVDLPENQHFIKDYQLYTKSVVLVKIRNGKQVEWKNLDKVWTLLQKKSDFQTYILKEVQAFTGKG